MALPSPKRWVSLGALAAAAGFIVHATANAHDIPVGFWLYVLAPYAIAAWFVMAPWGDTRAQDASGCIVSFAYLVVTYLSWRDAVFRPTSSTAGLIFLFLPIYLAVGAAFAWPLFYVIFKARGRRAQ